MLHLLSLGSLGSILSFNLQDETKDNTTLDKVAKVVEANVGDGRHETGQSLEEVSVDDFQDLEKSMVPKVCSCC